MQRVVAPHVARGALPADDRELAIVVGEFQAIALHVDVGDRVELRVASDERGSAIERGATATARVAAVMHTDLAEYDARFVVGSFVPVQRWLARGDTALAVELELRDDTAARRIAKALAAKLGDGYAVQDWCELNKALLGCAWRE